MIPVPTREQQFAFQALQQALTEEKAFIRIDFKRLNRYNSPFFNPWENLLPLIAVVLISFAIMFTDNLIIGLSVLVFLIFLYIILLPFILTPIMHARVLKRIVPRMEKIFGRLVLRRYFLGFKRRFLHRMQSSVGKLGSVCSRIFSGFDFARQTERRR